MGRADELNIFFDREPGIENMRADEPEISQRADNEPTVVFEGFPWNPSD